jgi:hypothetical protein
LTLRQLIGVAYQAICEAIGKEKADEALEGIAADYEPAVEARPHVSPAERESRRELLRLFGMGGVTS